MMDDALVGLEGISFHPKVQNFISAIGHRINGNIKALDTLVKSLESNSLLHKITVFLPMLTDKTDPLEQAAQCSINLIDLTDVVTDPNFSGSQFDSKLGHQASAELGDDMYPGYDPDADNIMFGCSVLSDNDRNEPVIHVSVSNPSISPRNNGQLTFWAYRTGGGFDANDRIRVGNASAIGSYLYNRSNAGNLKAFQNTSKLGEPTPQADWSGTITGNWGIGSLNWRACNYMFGTGFSETEALLYQQLIIDFNTEIGRPI